VQRAGFIPARAATCRDGVRLPADANLRAPAVSAYRLIESLRLIVGYKLLACLLANAELTDDVTVAVRIV
jgi:hypothetical protein